MNCAPGSYTVLGRDGTFATNGGVLVDYVYDNFFLANTSDSVVIVDQHAAHERLVYERLKRQREDNGVARQMMLIPAVVELDSADVDRLLDNAETLDRLGLKMPVAIDQFGDIAKQYHVESIPQTFLIDRQGKIRRILVGEKNLTEKLRETVRELLSEK